MRTAWGFLAVRLPLPEDPQWKADQVTILQALGVLDPTAGQDRDEGVRFELSDHVEAADAAVEHLAHDVHVENARRLLAQAKAIAELHVGQEGTALEDCKLHDSRFYYEGEFHAAVIYDRNRLHEGLTVPGPAIVSEMDSTTVVLPGYSARVDPVGNLLIEPNQ